MPTFHRSARFGVSVLCLAYAVALPLLSGCAPSNQAATSAQGKTDALLNVAYDPTRELYQDMNAAFQAQWKAKTGRDIKIDQSHGGSAKQARSVIDGLAADVVTLAISSDIDAIAKESKRLPENWQSRLPNNSVPMTSTVLFLVRKGNPKQIKDWDDLTKIPGLQIIAANPKTSGGARVVYLAAWGQALKKSGGSEEQARQYVTEVYKRVPVLDAGSRGAATSFVQRRLGDVPLTWENEAFLAMQESPEAEMEIVSPSVSIFAEPPVAVVDENAKAHGALEAANAYLEFLYSDEGQKVAAKNFYRPIKPEAADPADLARFANMDLFRVQDVFGGWNAAQQKHFIDGGEFDKIYAPQ